MSWRYAMGVAPYGHGELAEAADKQFRDRLRALISEYQQLGGTLASRQGAGLDITDEMRAIRTLPIEERREVYARKRLQDQVDWYSREAKSDERQTTLWLWVITILQLGGLVVASLQFAAFIEWNVTPLLAAAIAAVFAWLQLKRHQELAKAYGVAALELATLLSGVRDCDSAEKLAAFVEEAEEAMSREHTLWRARRT